MSHNSSPSHNNKQITLIPQIEELPSISNDDNDVYVIDDSLNLSNRHSEASYATLSPSSLDTDVPLHLPSIVDVGIDQELPIETHRSLTQNKSHMIFLCLSVMMGGAFNNVLGKVRSKPLGGCNYFVSIINAIAYSLVYVTILKVRQYRGLVRKDEIDFVWKTRPSRRRQPGAYIRSGSLSFWDNGTRPLLADSTPTPAAVNSRWQRLHEYIRRLGAWKYFVISGFCDFFGNIVAMIAQPFVPGPLFALMNQATLPAAAVVSYILLRRRYSIFQLLAILTVWMGGALALLPDLIKLARGDAAADTHAGHQAAMTVRYSLLVIIGTIPTALSSSIKEKVFKLFSARQMKMREQQAQRTHSGRVTALEGVKELRSRRVRQPTILEESKQTPQQPSKSVDPSQQQSEEMELPASSDRRDTSGEFELTERRRRRVPSFKTLDVFVISAYGSLFQLFFVPLAFPINMMLGQFGNHSIFTFLHAAVSCLLGNSTGDATLCHIITHNGMILPSSGGSEPSECWTSDGFPCEDYGCCHWAPVTYIPYLIVNILFNVLLLFLVVHGSAVVAFMALKGILPLAILLFATFNWPLLTDLDTQVSPTILASLVCVCIGIWWYRHASQQAAAAPSNQTH